MTATPNDYATEADNAENNLQIALGMLKQTNSRYWSKSVAFWTLSREYWSMDDEDRISKTGRSIAEVCDWLSSQQADSSLAAVKDV